LPNFKSLANLKKVVNSFYLCYSFSAP